MGRASTLAEFVSEFRYLARFRNAGISNISGVEAENRISHRMCSAEAILVLIRSEFYLRSHVSHHHAKCRLTAIGQRTAELMTI